MSKLFVLLPGLHGTDMLQHKIRSDLTPHGEVYEHLYPETGPQNLEEFRRTLIAYLEGASRKAILIGHSTGGLLAMLTSLKRPDLVEGMVLIDTASAAVRKKTLLKFASMLFPLIPKFIFGILSVLSMPFTANFFLMPLKEIIIFFKLSKSIDPKLISPRIASLISYDFRKTNISPFVDMPTLLIASRLDFTINSVTEAYSLDRRLNSSKVVVRPWSGHECLQERGFNVWNLIQGSRLFGGDQ